MSVQLSYSSDFFTILLNHESEVNDDFLLRKRINELSIPFVFPKFVIVDVKDDANKIRVVFILVSFLGYFVLPSDKQLLQAFNMALGVFKKDSHVKRRHDRLSTLDSLYYALSLFGAYYFSVAEVTVIAATKIGLVLIFRIFRIGT